MQLGMWEIHFEDLIFQIYTGMCVWSDQVRVLGHERLVGLLLHGMHLGAVELELVFPASLKVTLRAPEGLLPRVDSDMPNQFAVVAEHAPAMLARPGAGGGSSGVSIPAAAATTARVGEYYAGRQRDGTGQKLEESKKEEREWLVSVCW